MSRKKYSLSPNLRIRMAVYIPAYDENAFNEIHMPGNVHYAAAIYCL